jgi:hypothetical protein
MKRFISASRGILPGFAMLLIWAVSSAVAGTAAPKETPTFSVPGGVYTKDFNLSLSAKGSSAIIRYTVDESDPTEKSPQAGEPVAISNTTVVKARLYPKGSPPGPIRIEVYTMVDSTLAETTSNLPMVLVHNVAGRMNSRNAAPCYARFFSAGKGRSSMTGTIDFEGLGTVKRRGRSSLEYPKNSFTLHTVDSQGDPLKAPILGLPKESAWILYAPYPDKTLMRDALAYELSNEMGRYAPRTKFVELYVSRPGTKVTRRSYAGVYVLMEKIKRDKNRVNIEKLTPNDNKEPEISGGYIFKRDHMDKGEPGFTTSHGNHFYYDTPKAEEITSAQRSWLLNYLNRAESALYGPRFRDPVNGYAAYIDADSLIDHHWIVELSKNIDGIRFSNFLHKDRGGKIKMEPIWDWNLSFGNAYGKGGYLPEEWYADQLRSSEYLWFPRLFQDPDFQQKYIDRWGVLRTNIFSASHILARVDEMAKQLNEAQERNFRRWPIMGRSIHPNYYVGQSYAEEVKWLKNWVRMRINWIDKQFLSAPTFFVEKAGNDSASRRVGLAGSGGKIYYTSNGGDPRLPGGKISPEAKIYSGPISINKTEKVMARIFGGNKWSSPTLVQCPN